MGKGEICLEKQNISEPSGRATQAMEYKTTTPRLSNCDLDLKYFEKSEKKLTKFFV